MDALKHSVSNLPARWRWAVTAAYVAVLYLSLPFTKDLVLSLKALHLFPAVVTAIYLAIAAVVLWLMLFLYRIRDAAAYILMTCLAVILAYFVLGLEVPEERVHFVQYGLLSVSVCYSLRPKVAVPKLYVQTFLLTAAGGIVDESLQYFIPSRVFDLRDIGFNVTLRALFSLPIGGRPKGTGIGLALCRNVIEALGGGVEAMNLAPRGALFSVTLPPVAGHT